MSSLELGAVAQVLDPVGGGADPLHDPDRQLEGAGVELFVVVGDDGEVPGRGVLGEGLHGLVGLGGAGLVVGFSRSQKAAIAWLTGSGVTQAVAAAAKRAGLGTVHAHRLRHSAATGMLRAGAGLPHSGEA